MQLITIEEITMSDKILALFAGQELSEDFKANLTQVFADAVTESADAKVEELKESVRAELQTEYDNLVEAKTAELEELTNRYIAEEVVPHVDKYLATAISEWKADNKLAIENGAKVQLAESFLTGFVQLAESHNLDLPQLDKVADMQFKMAQMQESINNLTNQKVELSAENVRLVKESIVKQETASLSDVQVSKIQESVNKIVFSDEAAYAASVKAIVEATFPPAPTMPENIQSNVRPIVENNELNAQDKYYAELFAKMKQ